jgi:choline dehydrogenase-like flavoprotein
MLTDLADHPSGGTVEADVCVVGGGAAGIALAVELTDSLLKVALVETGGPHTEGGRPIYQVIGGRPPTLTVDRSRPTYFGGNTNYWAGNCRPLDAVDFESRDWIAHSGWPVQRQELLPYYERAQVVSGLGDFRWYDPDACGAQLKHPLLRVDPAVLTNRIVHTCPVLSFAELHHRRLETAGNVQVLMRAQALRLRTNATDERVSAVELVSPDGRELRVEAGVFVLAAGGVENARLLLCSGGLGNGHDLVGRFFMEHWYVDLGLGPWDSALDLTAHTYRRNQELGGAGIWAQIALSEERMQAARVPGLSVWFLRTPYSTPGVEGLSRLAAMARGRWRDAQLVTDTRLLLSDSGEVSRHVLRKLARRSAPSEGYSLRVQLEQTPDPENRVRLSADTDRFGQPLPELALRLPDEERRGHIRSLESVASELGLNGKRLAGQLALLLDAGRFDFFWHHMGTTRMADDPRQGVVDRNCRVHGCSNVFVAGSSVFPTGGTAAPTLTIVALALRLADHIRGLSHP